MAAKGKVSAEEMNQLAERGIPAWRMLADGIGVSIPQAMKMAEKGAIDANKAIVSIINGMNEKFPDMMAKQSQSFSGAMSNLQDSADIALTKKERDGYNEFPVMLDGYHTQCFECAAAAKARLSQGSGTSLGTDDVQSEPESGTPDIPFGGPTDQDESLEVDTPAEVAPKRPRPKRKAKKATVVA
jgi:hypothetical protein